MLRVNVSAVDPQLVPERPVFVTHDDRRARWLRRAAVAVTVLACAWLVALGLGVLGLGSLPGLSLVKAETARQPRQSNERSTLHARGAPVVTSRAAAEARRPASTAQTRIAAAVAPTQRARTSHPARPAARPAPQPAP